ncbi:PLAC8-domain-containing protein [Dacryopinax primogenitus]|uniref:PLAC8-domain-containing protein n=1 Tax=Dacryopinax primogenitus (strain DJM 731) TaxID=1858805 RepID=M5FT87_DACPD|nr:PLAC8-domain-containing protein [Dacryopinax primogenitus]EJT99228.1 PLAC8-domain-containing protein [Dacryopinax primogenitus]
MSKPPSRPTPVYAQPQRKEEMLPLPPRLLQPPTYHPSRNGRAEWHTGLFGCCGAIDICCPALVCPCWVYSRNRARLRHLSGTGQPLGRETSAWDGNCGLYALLTAVGCWGWVLEGNVRRGIRERYNIPGDSCTDTLTTLLCPPCALTQESLELSIEERRLRQERLQGTAGIYGPMDDSVLEDPVGCGEVCCCCCRMAAGGGRGCRW